MRLWLVALLLCALALVIGAAGGIPDIGEIMFHSRDLGNVEAGCALGYDRDRHEFVCVTAPGGGPGTPARLVTALVTLSQGRETTVANADTTATSYVQCGCGGGADAQCNTGGQWIARLRVVSATTGQFTLAHGQAMGDEQVVCVIGST